MFCLRNEIRQEPDSQKTFRQPLPEEQRVKEEGQPSYIETSVHAS